MSAQSQGAVAPLSRRRPGPVSPGSVQGHRLRCHGRGSPRCWVFSCRRAGSGQRRTFLARASPPSSWWYRSRCPRRGHSVADVRWPNPRPARGWLGSSTPRSPGRPANVDDPEHRYGPAHGHRRRDRSAQRKAGGAVVRDIRPVSRGPGYRGCQGRIMSCRSSVSFTVAHPPRSPVRGSGRHPASAVRSAARRLLSGP